MPAVIVPDQAAVLDWVFADGPPKQAVVYDNNHNQDFHALVPQSVPKEQHWVNEEQRLYDALEVERLFKEKETKAKVSYSCCLLIYIVKVCISDKTCFVED